MLKRVKKTSTRLTLCPRGGRNDCINPQHQASITGREATKAEVIKRMSSVGIIHIAAHGNKRTGEIALSPNSAWTSRFPQKKDFILQMSDVLTANLRARLVVLS